jgi:hypothetical protein
MFKIFKSDMLVIPEFGRLKQKDNQNQCQLECVVRRCPYQSQAGNPKQGTMVISRLRFLSP